MYKRSNHSLALMRKMELDLLCLHCRRALWIPGEDLMDICTEVCKGISQHEQSRPDSLMLALIMVTITGGDIFFINLLGEHLI